ncbi:MAG: hypothetical protein HY814_13840 [Candidatus Riflebacteria bacterium]|nr:hypothetical protein [Candidatus Riflebacteria bacterium]
MRKAALLVALILAGLGMDLVLDLYGGDSARPPTGADLVRSFLGNLSYEVRGLAARLLYLKIDRYVHEGKRLDLGHGAFGVTMVGNTEIVPLYGLVTFLDPHFMEAFSLGGEHLLYGLGKVDEGLGLLETGIRYNPDNPLTSELLGQLGVYYMKEVEQPARAIPYFERALKLRAKLADDRVPQGFVFSEPQLRGLLATASFRTGDPAAARQWLKAPALLPRDSELFDALGLPHPTTQPPSHPTTQPPNHPATQPPSHRQESPGPPPADKTGHRHDEELEDPRWWADPEKRERLHGQLALAGILATLLAIPWGRLLRRGSRPKR